MVLVHFLFSSRFQQYSRLGMEEKHINQHIINVQWSSMNEKWKKKINAVKSLSQVKDISSFLCSDHNQHTCRI